MGTVLIMLGYFLFGLLAAAVAGLAYVRFAPTDAARWHGVDLPQGKAGDFTAEGSFTVVRDAPDAAAQLHRLDTIIRDTPRTSRIAGSVESGRITYVTRSKTIGFPDFTTVGTGPNNASLSIHGRLRFGRSDVGVNKARIEGWLAQLDGTVPAGTPAK